MMTRDASIGGLLLVILIAGFAALVVALLRHRGARRAFFVVGGILGVTLVLLLAAAFFTRATRVVSVEYTTPSRHMTYNDVHGGHEIIYPRQSPLADSHTVLTPTPSHAPRAVPAPAEATSGADWPLIDEQFLADQYPSEKAAAEALALHLVKSWAQAQPENPFGAADDASHREIVVCGNAPREVLATAISTLQGRYPGVHIGPPQIGKVLGNAARSLGAGVSAGSQPADGAESRPLILQLEVTGKGTMTRYKNPTQHEVGTLQGSWNYPGGTISRSVNWVSAPWLRGWPADDISSGQRTSGGWVVGYSSSLCTSPAEAHRAARAAAAEELLQEARIAIQQRYMARPDWLTTHLSGSSGDAWLRGMLAAEINSNRPVADEFAQKFDRGYGTVYRQAVLVSDTAQVIRRVSDQFETRVHVQHESWKSIFVSFGGLMLLVLVVYLFLNAATRGYYTWSLRIASVVLIIGGILAVLAIA